MDRRTRKTIAWVTGNRDAKTFRGLYNKVADVNGNYYTDKWQGFAKEDRHITGKSGTRTIERDNSNTRHYLGRMVRRTKIVTKCTEMLGLSMGLLVFLKDEDTFTSLLECVHLSLC